MVPVADWFRRPTRLGLGPAGRDKFSKPTAYGKAIQYCPSARALLQGDTSQWGIGNVLGVRVTGFWGIVAVAGVCVVGTSIAVSSGAAAASSVADANPASDAL